MRFKNLSLQGYKSFATKTEFQFPTGVTAVVGPNGSGKSNIADGIRWALGEQRMRALRGKSSADMIFSGGRRRSQAGMAEVSLTLDNSDDWLPIAFSEVTITRRAYRSGENEYLLNGSRVRLRDVAALLAEGGLAQRTYTVIGQGLVDAALSLRAQERRELFEEAAGISVYRARREESVRRLEETQSNLERVRDIIGEITPRLNRLEREVERVEEHRRLNSHLEGLQRTWYGYQWGRLQAALDHASKRAAMLESVLGERQNEASVLNEHLLQLRQRESELRDGLRDWHRESAERHDRVSGVQRELAVAEERTRLLQVRREELAAELEPLQGQQEAQAEKVSAARTQVQRLAGDLAACREHLAAMEREWAAAQDQARGPDRQRAEVEQQLRARREGMARLNRELLEARAEEAHLTGEREALSRLRDVAAFDAGVQVLMEAAPEGIVGPLAALVQVPKEWRAAIEVALGADLQAVVVERASIVEEARQLVEAAGAYLTLLPLDTLRPAPHMPSQVLRAADIVTCDERVQPAVEALLGAVALCDDLQAAMALAPSMGAGSRCVTRTGVVVRADGALQVGQPGVGDVLVDDQAQQALDGRLQEIRQRCQGITTQQQAEAGQIAALEAELEDLARQAAAAQEEAARVERETLGKARTEVAVAEEMLRSQRAVLEREEALLERLHAQEAARRERVRELEAEQSAIAARVEALSGEAARVEDALRQTRGRIDPAEKELVRLREEQVALEKNERHSHDRVRSAEAQHGRAQLTVDRRRDELKLLSQRIEEELGLVEVELADSVTAQTPLPLRPHVSSLPVVEELPEGLEAEIQRLKAHIRRMGGVNPNAPDDYAEVKERHQFLTEQSADLETASAQLREVVAELDALMEKAFRETFDAVAARFPETFKALFDGGAARLELTEPDDLLNSGVDIVARPPGKRPQRLALLSGGERSLTAVALLFAILHVSPAPFCVLDEVDAMLDEANVGRFRALLEDLSKLTQFIVITHNRGTVEAADTIYGVSMGTDGVSQVVSLKMDQD